MATSMTEGEFLDWFEAVDLGPLEDVRDFVEAHARQNANDAEDFYRCARDTVRLYMDHSEHAEIFDFYR